MAKHYHFHLNTFDLFLAHQYQKDNALLVDLHTATVATLDMIWPAAALRHGFTKQANINN